MDTWNEDEMNALARGLGCEESSFRANGTTYTYFLGPASLFVRQGGMRAIYAFGSAARALGHPQRDAAFLIREMAPSLLG